MLVGWLKQPIWPSRPMGLLGPSVDASVAINTKYESYLWWAMVFMSRSRHDASRLTTFLGWIVVEWYLLSVSYDSEKPSKIIIQPSNHRLPIERKAEA